MSSIRGNRGAGSARRPHTSREKRAGVVERPPCPYGQQKQGSRPLPTAAGVVPGRGVRARVPIVRPATVGSCVRRGGRDVSCPRARGAGDGLEELSATRSPPDTAGGPRWPGRTSPAASHPPPKTKETSHGLEELTRSAHPDPTTSHEEAGDGLEELSGMIPRTRRSPERGPAWPERTEAAHPASDHTGAARAVLAGGPL